MSAPIVFTNSENPRITSAIGSSFIIHEWRGSGPDYMHVHYADDEAWHVIEGTLTFKFSNRTFIAQKGTTVFVPAGTPHTYTADSSARYLLILTERLNKLIEELHTAPFATHNEVMKKYQSEIVLTR
jgi:mannose-6-phosphate isomerase-like protein (cupin superfamily)